MTQQREPNRSRSAQAADAELRALINRRRSELGLSISTLARELNVSPGAVGHWAVGRRVPLPSEVPGLARLLQLDPDRLLALASAARHHRRLTYPGAARRPGAPDGSRPAPTAGGLHTALLQAAVDHVEEAALVLDANGHILAANSAARKPGPGRIVSLHYREVWNAWGDATDQSGQAVPASRSPLGRALRYRRRVDDRYVRLTRADGAVLELSFTVTPIFAMKRCIGAIARWRSIK